MTACDWCERPSSSLTACEGERLCWPCTEAYLAESLGEMKAQRYGEAYRHTPTAELPITPRAWRYR